MLFTALSAWMMGREAARQCASHVRNVAANSADRGPEGLSFTKGGHRPMIPGKLATAPWAVGEGIEKVVEDYAVEVAKAMNI